ncbi:hypothetical protein M413DRAFT_386523 [Hebeloma cylindrosporum]|uniref:NACHT domain-containing protein n=1 Tax=Hebeloma cylindrosporum TaxID=76867 RepID=A0A0C3CJ11_HEBCY|nr:hypothetical protein M413DRAFT_386523 [Hebeloma cylindrosporum h7]
MERLRSLSKDFPLYEPLAGDVPTTPSSAIYKRVEAWISRMELDNHHDPSLEQHAFLWLTGATPRRTTTRNIAIMTHSSGRLAASLFFQGSPRTFDTLEESMVIQALAYQLGMNIEGMCSRIGDTVEKNPRLLKEGSADEIATKLIVEPLKAVVAAVQHHEDQGDEMPLTKVKSQPRLVIVDGLDEAPFSSEVQVHLLQILASIVNGLGAAFPLFFFISSAPEKHISEVFLNDPMISCTTRLCLGAGQRLEVDVGMFVTSAFEDVKKTYPDPMKIPSTWPSERDIFDLTIICCHDPSTYMPTAMTYLKSHYGPGSPPERLEALLKFPLVYDPHSSLPLVPLDSIYYEILSSASRIDEALDVLAVVCLSHHVKISPTSLDDFLGYPPGKVRETLKHLDSVIKLSNDDAEIRFDPKFKEFLLDPELSKEFNLAEEAGHALITKCVLKRIKPDLVDTRNWWEIEALYYHLPRSTPVPEILESLFKLDLSSYLHFLSIAVLTEILYPTGQVFGKNMASSVNQLFMWFHGKHLPGYSNDLLGHHMAAIDKWMCDQLSVEAKLVEFLPSDAHLCLGERELAKELLSVLSKDGASPADCIVLSILLARPEEEYMVVRQFIDDPLRCGGYFLDADRCARLAAACFRYIVSCGLHNDSRHPSQIVVDTSHIAVRSQPHADAVLPGINLRSIDIRHRGALSLLGKLIPRAAKNRELQKLLGEYTISHSDPKDVFYSEKATAAGAAKKYMTECGQKSIAASSITLLHQKHIVWPLCLVVVSATIIISISLVVGQ